MTLWEHIKAVVKDGNNVTEMNLRCMSKYVIASLIELTNSRHKSTVALKCNSFRSPHHTQLANSDLVLHESPQCSKFTMKLTYWLNMIVFVCHTSDKKIGGEGARVRVPSLHLSCVRPVGLHPSILTVSGYGVDGIGRSCMMMMMMMMMMWCVIDWVMCWRRLNTQIRIYVRMDEKGTVSV